MNAAFFALPYDRPIGQHFEIQSRRDIGWRIDPACGFHRLPGFNIGPVFIFLYQSLHIWGLHFLGAAGGLGEEATSAAQLAVDARGHFADGFFFLRNHQIGHQGGCHLFGRCCIAIPIDHGLRCDRHERCKPRIIDRLTQESQNRVNKNHNDKRQKGKSQPKGPRSASKQRLR